VPELPEVEYVRRLLRRAMEGARIERVLVRRPDLRYPFAPDFVSRLEGQNVLAVRRRAKYLLIDLASGDALLMHLGMSGWFRVLRSHAKADLKVGLYDEVGGYARRLEKHDHVVFEMANGRTVVFSDPRRFGFMTLHGPGELATHAALSKLGAEPLGRGFDAAALAKELGRRKTSLKAALLDQRVIAGLGNIYVSEALHRARLSPKRRASTLATKSGGPRPPVRDLVAAIGEVLNKAIRNQYRTGSDDPFVVYDKEGERCPRRGCAGTIARIVQAGRSTFYCRTCQR
jgi:formamidopyrimidine-DNA glycosylase